MPTTQKNTQNSPEQENATTIFLCAGGTGGHMFPAIALAEDLKARGYRPVVLSDKRGLAYIDEGDMEVVTIPSSSLQGGAMAKLSGLFSLACGYLKTLSLIGRYKPALAIGFGGYPSLPSMMAAQHRHIPTIIHEQNAVIGKANAFLAPKADRIAVSYASMTGLDEVDRIRAVVTGNPVRGEISKLYSDAYTPLSETGHFNILVMGGSQGALVFGEVVPTALAGLSDEQRSRIQVVQQCLPADQEKIEDTYNAADIQFKLHQFISDIAGELKKAHLIIGRSGATTVAEITTAGRPAIFVPYPHHKDQQQAINAEAVAEQGGAWMMLETGFTSDALKTKIETFFHNPQSLFDAAEAARGLARPDAARKLGNLITALASGWDHSGGKV